MTQHEFLAQFAAQFEETDAATITLSTNFRELDEWSSMMALLIIAMVDDEYNVTLTGDDIRASNTATDLYEKIVAKS